ncbi:hypothetical protein [Aeoliella sp.]|uniref:hypothetical protein n=1 Tax=Aeoliella sp. TaxID=2795800 RepID=UPI003CCB9021
MTAEESLARYGLVPAKADLPSIRTLLQQEIACGREGRPSEEDVALLCCVQLFSAGELQDVLFVWSAKQSCFDLGSLIDVQLMCGAGLDETKEYLTEQESEPARIALDYLRACEEAGDFDGFTPDSQLAAYRTYFL